MWRPDDGRGGREGDRGAGGGVDDGVAIAGVANGRKAVEDGRGGRGRDGVGE